MSLVATRNVTQVLANITLPYYAKSLLFWTVEYPLLLLYMHGPRFGSWGFWNGMDYWHICAEMSGVPSTHWLIPENGVTCYQLIYQRFYSFIVLLYVSLYAAVLACLCLRCLKAIANVRQHQPFSIVRE